MKKVFQIIMSFFFLVTILVIGNKGLFFGNNDPPPIEKKISSVLAKDQSSSFESLNEVLKIKKPLQLYYHKQIFFPVLEKHSDIFFTLTPRNSPQNPYQGKKIRDGTVVHNSHNYVTSSSFDLFFRRPRDRIRQVKTSLFNYV